MPSSYEPGEVARRLTADDLAVVDVRDRQEWRNAHVDGALHLPLDELDQRAEELPRDRALAFICRTGKRSETAAERAAAQGLEAGNVTGGMQAWAAAGLPVRRGGAAT
jgi:rhodanese-related sulfurtransferase